MAIFDFITGLKQKAPQYGNIVSELIAPEMVQGGEELTVQALPNRMQRAGNRLVDAIFGKMVDNSTVDNASLDDNTLSATIRNPQRQGGILADLQSGFNENLNNAYQPQNLMGNGGSLARKIGEGFGTALRFADSPLGRGLLVGGAIGALGGTPAQMAAFGLSSGAKNQGLRTADQLYRDSLTEQGYDTSNLRGYIDRDAYNNISLNNYRMDNTLNNEVRNVLRLLQNNEISPEQASEYLKSLGYDFGTMGYSNQTINTKNKSKILPYQIENLDARTQATKTNAANNTKRTNAYVDAQNKKGSNGSNKKDETKPIGVTKSGVKYKVVE